MQSFVLVYKDRDGVIKRLTSRSNQQRQTIAKKFNIRYKQVKISSVNRFALFRTGKSRDNCLVYG
jgi:hypothetical protein